jgi:hypothetical protein
MPLGLDKLGPRDWSAELDTNRSQERWKKMSFLGWPVQRHIQSESSMRRRKAIALRIICKFAEVFKEIDYELLWNVPTINAQAWRLGNHLRVTVYGGLARHPAMTACGLSLMLAHETGHHLGGAAIGP